MSLSKQVVEGLVEAGAEYVAARCPTPAASIDNVLMQAYSTCVHLLGGYIWQHCTPSVIGIVGQAGTEEVLNNMTRGFGMPLVHAVQVYLDVGTLEPPVKVGRDAIADAYEAFLTKEKAGLVADGIMKSARMFGYALSFAIIRRSGKKLTDRFLAHAAHNLRIFAKDDSGTLGRITSVLAYLRMVKAVFGRRSSRFMIMSEFACALVNYLITIDSFWQTITTNQAARRIALLAPAIRTAFTENIQAFALTVLGCGSLWYLLWRYTRATKVIRVPPVQTPSALLDALRAVELAAHLNALPCSRVVLGGVELPADVNGATEHACAPICDCGNEGLALVATDDVALAARFATPYVITASNAPLDRSAVVGHANVTFVGVKTIPNGVGKLHLAVGTLQRSLEIVRPSPHRFVANEGTVDYDSRRGEYIFASDYGQDRVPAAVVNNCATTLADMKRGPKFYSTVRAYTLGQLASVKCAARCPVLVIKFIIMLCDFQAATMSQSVVADDPLEFGMLDRAITRLRLYVSRDISAALDMALSKLVMRAPAARYVFPWKWQEVHLQNYEMLSLMVHCTPCEPRRINGPFQAPLPGANAGTDNGDEPRPGDDAAECDRVGGDPCIVMGSEDDAPVSGVSGEGEHHSDRGSLSVSECGESVCGDDFDPGRQAGVSGASPDVAEPIVDTPRNGGGARTRWMASLGGSLPTREENSTTHVRGRSTTHDHAGRVRKALPDLLVCFQVQRPGQNAATASGFVNVLWDRDGVLCEIPGLGCGQFGPALFLAAFGERPTQSVFEEVITKTYALYADGVRAGPGQKSRPIRDLNEFVGAVRRVASVHNAAAQRARGAIVGFPAGVDPPPLALAMVPGTGSRKPCVDDRAAADAVRGMGIEVPTRPGRHTQNSPVRVRDNGRQSKQGAPRKELHKGGNHGKKYRSAEYFPTGSRPNGAFGPRHRINGQGSSQLPVHGEGAESRGAGSKA